MHSGIISAAHGVGTATREAIVGALEYPFVGRRNPLEGGLAKALAPWVTDYFGASAATRIASWKVHELASGWFPQADDEHLMIGASFFCFRLLLDDAVDDTSLGRNPEAMKPVMERLDAVLQRPRGQYDEQFSRGFADILQRAERGMTAEGYNAFHGACAAMLGAFLWEASNRAIDWAPDESAYTMLRPNASGATAAFGLVTTLQDLGLATEQVDGELSTLLTHAGRIVCWVNDLLSYEKETARGDVHNLLIVLQRRRGLSQDEALWRAVEITNREVACFASAERMLRRKAGLGFPTFIAGVHCALSSSLDWTYTSARYTRGAEAVERSA